jgi:hypothetical protein
LYLLPLFLLGEDSYINTFDNLDFAFTHIKLLVESGTLFASSETIVPQINMPRIVMGTEFSLWVLLYSLLPPLYAYLTGMAIAHIIGFTGMYLLLKRHFIPEVENDYINILVSLCFALLPYFPIAGISVAGQPLALLAFLNFRCRQQTIKDWLILLGIPFFSSFILSFLFFISIMGFIWLYDLINRKDANPKFLLSIVFMTIVFIGVEYRQFLFQLNPFFVSHRYEFGEYHIESLSILQSLQRTLFHFIFGFFHALSLQSYSIGLSVTLTLAVFLLNRRSRQMLESTYFILLGSAALISLSFGLWNSSFAFQVKSTFPLIRIFHFGRFYWLHPLIWHLLFAFSLLFITRTLIKRGKHIAYAFIILQILYCFYMSDFALEMRRNDITYKEFHAEEQFREIRDYIGEPQETYRVVSIGMHPSVALFNGFYSADFYLSNYPLEYKHRFRKIIARELEKSDAIREYYDEWGSRLYAFTSALEKDYIKKDKIKSGPIAPIRDLEFNIEAMKELGIRYVLSRVPIENQFTFMKHFSHPESAWEIYLYRVSR